MTEITSFVLRCMNSGQWISNISLHFYEMNFFYIFTAWYLNISLNSLKHKNYATLLGFFNSEISWGMSLFLLY